tara:strand:+ start:319 stop:450 length:132 start_codon:yes stop_codon:yes gene_type:complete
MYKALLKGKACLNTVGKYYFYEGKGNKRQRKAVKGIDMENLFL